MTGVPNSESPAWLRAADAGVACVRVLLRDPHLCSWPAAAATLRGGRRCIRVTDHPRRSRYRCSRGCGCVIRAGRLAAPWPVLREAGGVLPQPSLIHTSKISLSRSGSRGVTFGQPRCHARAETLDILSLTIISLELRLCKLLDVQCTALHDVHVYRSMFSPSPDVSPNTYCQLTQVASTHTAT